MKRTVPPFAGLRAGAAPLAAVILLSALGTGLRARHLGDDVRCDEAITYLSYVSQGWPVALGDLRIANNHVLNTVLAKTAVAALGDTLFAFRLPNFLGGLALLAATWWLARSLFGDAAGLAALAFVAVSPVLIQYATLARGFGLSTLGATFAWALTEKRLRERTTFATGAAPVVAELATTLERLGEGATAFVVPPDYAAPLRYYWRAKPRLAAALRENPDKVFTLRAFMAVLRGGAPETMAAMCAGGKGVLAERVFIRRLEYLDVWRVKLVVTD